MLGRGMMDAIPVHGFQQAPPFKVGTFINRTIEKGGLLWLKKK